jgi:hypothetical protein
MSQLNIDQMVFWENLKRAFGPSLVFFIFVAIYTTLTLNLPVSHEEVQGKVVRSIPAVDYKSAITASTFIELENGRVVLVPLAANIPLPHDGDVIKVVRYLNRFFGDSFGLQQ